MRLVSWLAVLGCLPAWGEEAPPPPVSLSGYVEAYYQHNFNSPVDGLTRWRGFDNRAEALTLSNVSLAAKWEGQRAAGRLALQWGATPASYYLSEPAQEGSAGLNANGPAVWQFLQEAWGSHRLEVGPGVTVAAGLFTSPIGPEVIPVRDNWNWSRSNLFFALPYYHVGATASAPVGGPWSVAVGVFNGWNAVVDANREKSVMVRAYSDAARPLSGALLYFGGVERPSGAPEGRAWRHLVDAQATWRANDGWALVLHGDGGWEPNRFGTSAWVAAAASVRWSPLDVLAVSARLDGFREWVAGGAEGRASPLFFPVPWVASGTATVDWHPEPGLSVRLEYRHDHADGPIYGARTLGAQLATQDTVTLGAVAGF